MTTITIEQDLNLKNTRFKNKAELLRYLVLHEDENTDDGDFKDTVVNDEIVEEMEKTKKMHAENPHSLRRSIL